MNPVTISFDEIRTIRQFFIFAIFVFIVNLEECYEPGVCVSQLATYVKSQISAQYRTNYYPLK